MDHRQLVRDPSIVERASTPTKLGNGSLSLYDAVALRANELLYPWNARM
jgi:hypothetical protein